MAAHRRIGRWPLAVGVLTLVSTVGLSGCGFGTGVSWQRELTMRAAFDFNCPEAQIGMVAVSANGQQQGVTGCGKRATYVYVQPNWIMNTATGKPETTEQSLASAAKTQNQDSTPPVAAAEAPSESSDENKDELQSMFDSGIKKIDDNNYEIDKALVDKVLANPMTLAKGARVVPAVKNGQPDGFKLYAIRPSSVYARLGLSNGDTLQSINGFELTSADKALEVYTKLREASSLEMGLTRRGKPVTLKYTIR